MADAVAPIAFAIKGGPHARLLWQYKSTRRAVADARHAMTIRAMLLVFLRDTPSGAPLLPARRTSPSSRQPGGGQARIRCALWCRAT
jgi:hypothetical protein